MAYAQQPPQMYAAPTTYAAAPAMYAAPSQTYAAPAQSYGASPVKTYMGASYPSVEAYQEAKARERAGLTNDQNNGYDDGRQDQAAPEGEEDPTVVRMQVPDEALPGTKLQCT